MYFLVTDHSLFVNDGHVFLLRLVSYIEAIKQQNTSLPILCRALMLFKFQRDRGMLFAVIKIKCSFEEADFYLLK